MDRTWTRHPTSTGIGGDRDYLCAHCGLRSPPGSTQGALLPDATVIDPQDRGRDGRRYVIACGTEHLQVLIDRARRDCVKRGIVWHSFAGLSGVIEVERNAFANGPNAVTCTYIFWRCQNCAI